jgi:hypothetical protein
VFGFIANMSIVHAYIILSVGMPGLSPEGVLEKHIIDLLNESKFVVEGTIISSNPYANTDMRRSSNLIVKNAICGEVAVGDQVEVSWSAPQFVAENGRVWVRSLSSNQQLDSFEGQPALWILKEYRGLVCIAEPIVLANLTPNRIISLLEAVEKPNLETKCPHFVQYLKELLETKQGVQH